MTNENQTKINDLKVKVYDLIATHEQYQIMCQRLQQQINDLNRQISDLQNQKEAIATK